SLPARGSCLAFRPMSLPEGFKAMLDAMGESMAGVAAALEGPAAPSAIRLNALKGGTAPANSSPVEWCEGGYYLAERPRFTLDPALHQGLYYVQDASSMAHAAAVTEAARVSGSESPLRFLDACAAPGGKTIAAVDALPADALIVANEADPRRCSVLIENVVKHGSGRVAVSRDDASSIKAPAGFFDIIAADVPCSGEGMMRKEAVAASQWSPALVASCAALQRSIVDNLWRLLRPGGCFIYSTCTFNTSENEEIVDYIVNDLGADVLPVPALARPEITGAIDRDYAAYRFLPGHVRGEGQFIALLRKHGDAPAARIKPQKPAKTKTLIDTVQYLEGQWTSQTANDNIIAVDNRHASMLAELERTMHVVYKGVELGTVKGRDFIPAQALAMAASLREDAFPRVEVDRDTALQYLAKQAVILPDSSPRGIVLLTHGERPLGFVKNLGNRSNNLYPAHWRILNL
ncbi:MAG: RsmB/NOP family class I SAM-dependent RNA methyltransferase, partial [Muribaculaceae bacterium]|nr:RsmB/NOP family class I SAM-dependent RNA methyltransferase [Muribaculaceae bacterium]